jgi:hypothetical protein
MCVALYMCVCLLIIPVSDLSLIIPWSISIIPLLDNLPLSHFSWHTLTYVPPKHSYKTKRRHSMIDYIINFSSELLNWKYISMLYTFHVTSRSIYVRAPAFACMCIFAVCLWKWIHGFSLFHVDCVVRFFSNLWMWTSPRGTCCLPLQGGSKQGEINKEESEHLKELLTWNEIFFFRISKWQEFNFEMQFWKSRLTCELNACPKISPSFFAYISDFPVSVA